MFNGTSAALEQRAERLALRDMRVLPESLARAGERHRIGVRELDRLRAQRRRWAATSSASGHVLFEARATRTTSEAASETVSAALMPPPYPGTAAVMSSATPATGRSMIEGCI